MPRILIRKDLRPYRCIMPNNILMCIENHTDFSRPWTETVTSQVVDNEMNWLFLVYLNGCSNDTETNTIDTARTYKNKKLVG